MVMKVEVEISPSTSHSVRFLADSAEKGRDFDPWFALGASSTVTFALGGLAGKARRRLVTLGTLFQAKQAIA